MSVAHDQSGEWATRWYQGRKVLITGGTSGIGAGLARGFLQAGADVTITGVTDAEVKAAADDPELGKAKVHRLDVQDSADINALLKAQQDLDVIVNCAGVIRRSDELDPTVFESVVDINLNGTMRMCSAARPLLERSNGTIRQSRVDAVFFWRRPRPRLRRQQGRDRATYEITRHRLCQGRHSRQRHRAGLDRYATHLCIACK